MSNTAEQSRRDAFVARESIRIAIASILRAPPANDPRHPSFGDRVLCITGRSRTGLSQAHVAKAARIALDTFEPLIEVRGIAVEMTPASAVNAITVHYEVIETGVLHDMRVEIPT